MLFCQANDVSGPYEQGAEIAGDYGVCFDDEYPNEFGKTYFSQINLSINITISNFYFLPSLLSYVLKLALRFKQKRSG